MPGLRLSGGPSCHRGGRSFAGGLNPKPHLWGPSSPREGPACSQAPPCGRGGAWAVLTAVSAPECPPPSVRWLMAVTDGSGRNPHLCWGQGCEGRRDSGSAAEGPLRARRSPVSASPLRKTHLPRTRPGARGPLPLPLGGRGRGRVGSGRRRRDSPSRPEAFAPPSRVHPRAPAAARQPGERRRCDRWRAAASDSGTSHAPARPPPQAPGPGAAPPVAARPEGARTACSPPVNHRVSTQFSERDSREHGLGSPVWRFTDGGSVVGSGVGAVRGCRGGGRGRGHTSWGPGIRRWKEAPGGPLLGGGPSCGCTAATPSQEDRGSPPNLREPQGRPSPGLRDQEQARRTATGSEAATQPLGALVPPIRGSLRAERQPHAAAAPRVTLGCAATPPEGLRRPEGHGDPAAPPWGWLSKGQGLRGAAVTPPGSRKEDPA